MSTTQSAHYIVDESGQMNDWKTWGMGNNNARTIGRRPEVVPGVEPGKWRVVRSRVSRYGVRWYVERRGCHGIVSFPTWREAQDYADRMARTREYVLPRPQLNEAGYVEFDFTEWAGLDYTPEWPDGATYDRRTGPNKPPFGASVWIPREHWQPLALALLALAEQEEHA